MHWNVRQGNNDTLSFLTLGNLFSPVDAGTDALADRILGRALADFGDIRSGKAFGASGQLFEIHTRLRWYK